MLANKKCRIRKHHPLKRIYLHLTALKGERWLQKLFDSTWERQNRYYYGGKVNDVVIYYLFKILAECSAASILRLVC